MVRRRNYLAISLHLVWATKERQPFITPDIETRLYDFCAGVARRNRCDVLAINGTHDHIHVLLSFPSTVRLGDLMRDMKAGSSAFVMKELKPGGWFDWQDGYAAVSVSPQDRDRIVAYIRNQKQHHAKGTTDELLERDGDIYDGEEGPLA